MGPWARAASPDAAAGEALTDPPEDAGGARGPGDRAPSRAPDPRGAEHERSPTRVVVACPYLVDAAGPWRRAHPVRSHRCAARTPPPPIPALIQKRLCLTPDHPGCQHYLAAQRAREEALAADHIRPERLDASRFRLLTRPLPIAVDRTDVSVGRAWDRARPVGLAIAGLALAAALAVLGASFIPPAPPAGVAGSLTQPPVTGTVGTALPTQTAPTPTGAPVTVAPSASPSGAPPPSVGPSPTAGPTPTPRPTPHRYRVRRGDTLRRIAQRFGVTVRALMEANDIADPATIRIGQVIIIP